VRVGDRIGLSVMLGGVDVTAGVEGFHTRYGFDQRIAEVDVDFALTPTFVDWGTLEIKAGLTSIASDTFGPTTTRFNGLARNNGVTFWPYTPRLKGHGWLVLADATRVTDDLWAKYLSPTDNPDPLATPATWDPPGIDMTNDGNGQRDYDQVTSILHSCGLDTRTAGIGGFSYLLGTQTKAFEQFVWRRGQSGLEYIESLDAMAWFRTVETPDGFIWRRRATNLVPLFATVQYTLNENQDILEGATITRDIANIFNRVVVTGYDDGSGDNVWVAIGAAELLPPGILLMTETFQSPLIEHPIKGERYVAGPGVPPALVGTLVPGMSCQEVAEYWAGELSSPMLEAVVSTWRDEPFAPGDIVYLNCPHLLGVNQAMTLKHVECIVTPNSFTQVLTLRAQDYAGVRGPTVLPLPLGARTG
jgi:hypothetical protein